MTTSEFYQRACNDAAFRRAKLEDLRYFRIVGAGLIWLFGGLGTAHCLYAGFALGRWGAGVASFFAAIVAASTYSTCKNRIAALEVFEKGTNHFPQPPLRAAD